MLWDLAADASYGPMINPGCVGHCLPIVSMGQGGEATPQIGFWVLSQVSDFVKPGAYRILSPMQEGNLWTVAFQNPHNGSIVLVVLNAGGNPQPFAIQWHQATLAAKIPGGAVQTYVWSP